MTDPMRDRAKDFFKGGGPPTISFHDKNEPNRWFGVILGGTIIAEPRVRDRTDPETREVQRWADGNAKQQMEITVESIERDVTLPNGVTIHVTGLRNPADPKDLGHRRLFVGGYMVKAVRTALAECGAEGVGIGGQIFVAWTGREPAKNSAFNDGKLYSVFYVPPVISLPTGGGTPSAAAEAAVQSPFSAEYAAASQAQQAPAPPPAPAAVLSPDGQYRWDGAQWVPNAPQTPPPPPVAPPAPPPPPAAPVARQAPPAGNPFAGAPPAGNPYGQAAPPPPPPVPAGAGVNPFAGR